MDITWLFADRSFQCTEQFPSDKGLNILSCGSHIYGHALLPGGNAGDKHPCVIMLHGLPGYTTNQDIAQALRRIGFVVLNPFYRGAWGSCGYFTLSGMVRDVEAVAAWCQSEEAQQVYGIDAERVFLLGISMGGWAALHGLHRCPHIKGAIALAPADPRYLKDEQPHILKNACEKYGCLQIESAESFMEDAEFCCNALTLASLADKLKDRPLLMLGGKRDTVIPPDRAIMPFWGAMEQYDMVSDKVFIEMDAPHSFANCRLALTERIAQWLLTHLDHSDL